MHQIVQAFFNVYRLPLHLHHRQCCHVDVSAANAVSIRDGRGTVGGEGDRGGDVNFYSPERAMMWQTKM